MAKDEKYMKEIKLSRAKYDKEYQDLQKKGRSAYENEIEYESESQDLRSNCWTFCIYPGDSLPENYLNIIQNWHIPTLLSPVHDSDVNGNGMEKKKHIHVFMYFGKGANKSYDQVMKFVNKLHGCPCEVVNNSVGMIRYFIHADNPEKFQYDINDLVSTSGFRYMDAFNDVSTEDQIYDAIETFIKDSEIHNYFVLINKMKEANMKTEVNFIRRHSIHVCKYLDGAYQTRKENTKKNKEDATYLESIARYKIVNEIMAGMTKEQQHELVENVKKEIGND